MTPRPLTLNLTEGSVTFRFSAHAAQDLQNALQVLLERLKQAVNAGAAERNTPQEPLEYRYNGDIFLEVFCNPNIWPSPFAAKVLITLRDDRIRLSTEAELNRLLEDVAQYLEQF